VDISVCDPRTNEMVHFYTFEFRPDQVTATRVDSLGIQKKEFTSFHEAVYWVLACIDHMIEGFGWEYVNPNRGDVIVDRAAKEGAEWAINVLADKDQD
jgi:hypothetical protein